mgnify:CR=1 FL=1
MVKNDLIIATMDCIIAKLESSIKMINDIPNEYKNIDLTDIAMEIYDTSVYAREVRDNMINARNEQ